MSTTSSDSVERTVQLAGNSTFVVSLPKEWALALDIERGTSMHLYPHDDRLVLAPDALEEPDRESRIDAESMDPAAVCRCASAAYAAGYDRISVIDRRGIDRELQRRLTALFDGSLGVEITAERATAVVASDVLAATEVSLAQTVAQIRQRSLLMHEDATEAVLERDVTMAERVVDRDDDVDRLFAFVCRGFRRGLEDVTELDRLATDRRAAFSHYHTARQLERLADHAVRIATVARLQSDPPPSGIADALDEAAAASRNVVTRALADDVHAATAERSRAKATVDVAEELVIERGGVDAYHYGTVIESLRRTTALGGNLAVERFEPAVVGRPGDD